MLVTLEDTNFMVIHLDSASYMPAVTTGIAVTLQTILQDPYHSLDFVTRRLLAFGRKVVGKLLPHRAVRLPADLV